MRAPSHLRVVADERGVADQQLEDHHTQGPAIHALRVRLALHDLGRQVLGCAAERR